jgi:hypothetical protein
MPPAAAPSAASRSSSTLPEPCAAVLRSSRRKWARACWRPGPGAPTWRGQPRPQLGRRPTSDEQRRRRRGARWRGARRRPGWPSGTGRSASSSGGADTASGGERDGAEGRSCENRELFNFFLLAFFFSSTSRPRPCTLSLDLLLLDPLSPFSPLFPLHRESPQITPLK